MAEARPVTSPTGDQAYQFALMVTGGFPTMDAIRYFYPNESDQPTLAIYAADWSRSREVSEWVRKLQGKAFQEMTLEEKIACALDLHYAQAAYYLYTHNYATLNSQEKLKADTCRQTLEAKKAGTAGQNNPLAQFWDDLKKGSVKLGPTPVPRIQ